VVLLGASLVLTTRGIIGYRAWRHAQLVSKLEELGCLVVYAHNDHSDEEVESATSAWLRERLGDEAWGRVTRVSAYGTLRFSDRPLTAEETAEICEVCGRLGPLRSFAISSDSFRLEQIAHWQGLEELEELSIESQTLSDEDLAHIGKLSNLSQLALTAPELTAASLRHLAALTKLKSLTLRNAKLGGVNSPMSSKFSALELLTIENATELSDDTLVKLGPLPQLSEAYFDDSSIGDLAIAHLAKCPSLHTLSLGGTKVTDSSLPSLRSLATDHSLEILMLEGTVISDQGLVALAGAELQSLLLDKTAVTDEGLRSIAEMRALGFLSLSDTRVTGTGVAQLRFEEPLSLSLDGAPLSPEGIAALAKAKLDHLSVARTSFGDADLMLFADRASLETLDVTGTKVTAQGVLKFRQAREKRFAASAREDPLMLFSDFPDEGYAEPGSGMPYFGF
jgi:internalin A